MRTLDLSYLADTLFAVRLVPGGADHLVRNPSALETIEMGKFAELMSDGKSNEAITSALDLLARLIPSAPKDDICGMPPAQIIAVLAAVGEAARVVQSAGESLPNGRAGATMPSTPATSSDMSFGVSPPQPDAMYGPS